MHSVALAIGALTYGVITRRLRAGPVEPRGRHRERRAIRVAGGGGTMKARVTGLALALALGMAPGAFAQTRMIRIDGPLAGGVPTGDGDAEPIALTLPDAVRQGLEHNLAALVDEQRVQPGRRPALAGDVGLLPNVSGNLQAAREKSTSPRSASRRLAFHSSSGRSASMTRACGSRSRSWI